MHLVGDHESLGRNRRPRPCSRTRSDCATCRAGSNERRTSQSEITRLGIDASPATRRVVWSTTRDARSTSMASCLTAAAARPLPHAFLPRRRALPSSRCACRRAPRASSASSPISFSTVALFPGRPIPSDIRRAIFAALRERFRKRVRTANPGDVSAGAADDSRLIACAQSSESVG